METVVNAAPKVSIAKIKELLAEGYTRTSKNSGYDPEIGCIQDFYGLDNKNMKALFQDERLKNAKTHKKFVPTFIIEEDEDGSNTEVATAQVEVEASDVDGQESDVSTETPVVEGEVAESAFS